MAITLHIDGFADRLKGLEMDYYETHYGECPPIVTKTMERMNSLSAGTRNPTMEELIAISEAYDVSINYLVTGDEMFPSLHLLKKRDAQKILDEIEMLKPEIEI
ncbi:MAG: hypothetical protein IJI21_08820 [Clostridia bacterium]|nr:hypothetical protein [Clostridia bacterium]